MSNQNELLQTDARLSTHGCSLQYALECDTIEKAAPSNLWAARFYVALQVVKAPRLWHRPKTWSPGATDLPGACVPGTGRASLAALPLLHVRGLATP